MVLAVYFSVSFRRAPKSLASQYSPRGSRYICIGLCLLAESHQQLYSATFCLHAQTAKSWKSGDTEMANTEHSIVVLIEAQHCKRPQKDA